MKMTIECLRRFFRCYFSGFPGFEASDGCPGQPVPAEGRHVEEEDRTTLQLLHQRRSGEWNAIIEVKVALRH